MNNLEGYIAKDKSTLHIYITNVKEFHNLLSKAQEEADALQNTMRQLENFTFRY